ncbi:PhlD (plasmid) [Streptomyces graminifolii]|uniref:PhlD n=1 Tax=Streptomyces graminifolii TaxID=1266771 RepID=UPI004058CC53
MPAHIGRPETVLAEHRVTTDALIEHVRATYRNPDDPTRAHRSMAVWERLMRNSGVAERYWSRPLPEVTADLGVAHRARTAFGDALDLAETAAHRALDVAGLDPGDIDAIITSHTTSWSVPNLDVHLIERLGLRPTVSRMPLATLACSGGAHALVRALQYTQARFGARVLVVVAETLSTIYHQSEQTPQSMIYRTLFGDSAAATVVTGLHEFNETDVNGYVINDGFELAMPNSRDRYWGAIDEAGLHFDSTRAAASAAADALPYVTDWLDDRSVDWAAVHPGGPRIIDDVIGGLGLDADKDGRHSHDSLAENGNLGGAAVLDVLRRTYDDPPAPGAPGALVAFGPGFTVAGVYGTWA